MSASAARRAPLRRRGARALARIVRRVLVGAWHAAPDDVVCDARLARYLVREGVARRL